MVSDCKLSWDPIGCKHSNTSEERYTSPQLLYCTPLAPVLTQRRQRTPPSKPNTFFGRQRDLFLGLCVSHLGLVKTSDALEYTLVGLLFLDICGTTPGE